MITLKTLPEATSQEVFDQVVNHLRSQNERSSTNDGNDYCLYRKGNLKCAAGCLIADDEYNKNFENKSWTKLCDTYLVPSNHKILIIDLQNIHDNYPIENWEKQFSLIAEKYRLTYTPPAS